MGRKESGKRTEGVGEREKTAREGEGESLLTKYCYPTILILPQALLGSLRSPISLGACSQANRIGSHGVGKIKMSIRPVNNQ